jgi:hypothetical protein
MTTRILSVNRYKAENNQLEMAKEKISELFCIKIGIG